MRDQYPGSAAFGEGLPCDGLTVGAVVCDTGFPCAVTEATAVGAGFDGTAVVVVAGARGVAAATAEAIVDADGAAEGVVVGAIALAALAAGAGTSACGAPVSLTTVATPIDPTTRATAAMA